jgi:BirA family biotin operon repressor/biotin-[acetyl-CoA-carboxylase] ligase
VLIRDLAPDGWQVRVVEEVDSTQHEVVAAARAGAPELTAIIAEHQVAGRGRRDRTWSSPPRAGVTMSMLFRPVEASPWVGIAVAIGAVDGINGASEARLRLKWPNDLICGERKVGGVIAEVEGGSVIVGIGVNVTTSRGELPVETATSLLLEGISLDREIVVKAMLRGIADAYRRSPEQLRADYLELLDTIGRRVRVSTLQGDVEGVAETIDEHGHLIVDGRSFTVGDVIHLR